DVVLVEADGAKNCPLKFPGDNEPVIVPYSDRVFIVAGMDALFKPFAEAVFRSELFRERTGLDPRLVYPDIFLRLFSEDALLKGTAGMNRVAVLNKYDAYRHRHMAYILLRKIMEQTGITDGIISAAKYGIWYRARRES
ncbi:MAG: putative selenium-dependent hydroxylase accessory protein YqeC, partial [Deltaproteobacteria bacterium]|nr:putative selenium-dependent hydroxylase accessory protein YqeC [Deltaproteobacteria bacterium]